MKIGQLEPLVGKGIDVWGLVERVSIAAAVSVAKAIRKDQENVRSSVTCAVFGHGWFLIHL